MCRRRVAPPLAALLLLSTAPTQSPELVPRGQELLVALDAAWNAGDIDDYLRRFTPEQPLLHDQHGRRMRELASSARRLVRHSTCSDGRTIGEHLVFTVRYRYVARDGAPPGERAEHGLLVAVHRGSALQPVLAVDLPPSGWRANDVFRCPPCNYRLGGAPGWLCVPIAQECTAAIEGATFLLLGTDIALDLSVQIGELEEPAAVVADRLAGVAARPLRGARVEPAQPWQPPSLTKAMVGLTAARAVVDLPDHQQLQLHVVACDRLRHLLLLRGSTNALAAAADRVAALLATYQLLSDKLPPAEQVLGSLRHHTGGALHGGDYVNPVHEVAFTGPAGWSVSERGAGAAFQVVWTNAGGTGRTWLTGYRPPAGFTAWTADLADRWLADLRARLPGEGGEVDDSGWSDDDCGGHVRHVTFAPSRAADATAPQRCGRHLRLWLRPKALVVADGYAAEPADQQLLRRALESLRAP